MLSVTLLSGRVEDKGLRSQPRSCRRRCEGQLVTRVHPEDLRVSRANGRSRGQMGATSQGTERRQSHEGELAALGGAGSRRARPRQLHMISPSVSLATFLSGVILLPEADAV